MWPSRDKIKTTIIFLDAFDFPAALFLKCDYRPDSDSLNLLVAYHWRDAGRRSLGMRQNPGLTVVPNVRNRAMPFLLQFLPPPVQPPVEFVQAVFRRFDICSQKRTGVSFLLLFQ